VMMARRTAGEIELVIDIAALVLDHVRRYPSTSGSSTVPDSFPDGRTR
jgi:hypothetical protein